MTPDNFTQSTSSKLAERVGFLCSNLALWPKDTAQAYRGGVLVTPQAGSQHANHAVHPGENLTVPVHLHLFSIFQIQYKLPDSGRKDATLTYSGEVPPSRYLTNDFIQIAIFRASCTGTCGIGGIGVE